MKAKREVPPTPALTSQSCWVPAHHDPRQNSPGRYKTEEVGGERSDGDGLLGHVYRGEDSTCGPSCPLPEGSSEQILSSAFVCRSWSLLVFLHMPLRFFKTRGRSQVFFSKPQWKAVPVRGNVRKQFGVVQSVLGTPLATGSCGAHTGPGSKEKKRPCAHWSVQLPNS